jgi:predicted ester cyclase
LTSVPPPRVVDRDIPSRALGTHRGEFLGIARPGKRISFYTIDVMRVVNGKITDHWGAATLLDLLEQLGAVPRFGQLDA